MRDGIFLTRAGHPTVVIVQHTFERAARAQASALGLADLNIYVYEQHRAGDVDAEEALKGAAAVDPIRQLIERRT